MLLESPSCAAIPGSCARLAAGEAAIYKGTEAGPRTSNPEGQRTGRADGPPRATNTTLVTEEKHAVDETSDTCAHARLGERCVVKPNIFLIFCVPRDRPKRGTRARANTTLLTAIVLVVDRVTLAKGSSRRACVRRRNQTGQTDRPLEHRSEDARSACHETAEYEFLSAGQGEGSRELQESDQGRKLMTWLVSGSADAERVGGRDGKGGKPGGPSDPESVHVANKKRRGSATSYEKMTWKMMIYRGSPRKSLPSPARPRGLFK